VVFVELPAVGTEVEVGGEYGGVKVWMGMGMGMRVSMCKGDGSEWSGDKDEILRIIGPVFANTVEPTGT